MGHKAKWEYFRTVYARHRKSGREAKQVMLNGICLNTGCNRKYAIRLINGAPPGKQAERRSQGPRPRCGPQVLSILAAIWEAAGYPWSVRLKALLPNWMPWILKRCRLHLELSRNWFPVPCRSSIPNQVKEQLSDVAKAIYGLDNFDHGGQIAEAFSGGL